MLSRVRTFLVRCGQPAVTRVLGLALYGPQAASTRQRLEQYVPGLAEQGIDLHIDYLLGNDYLQRRFSGRSPSWSKLLHSGWQRLAQLRQQDTFDLALVYCELLPFTPWWVERQLLSIPCIYDFDDAFYLKYQTGKRRLIRPLLGNKVHAMIANATAVTAGNRTLMAYAMERNANVELLPTVVDTTRYRPHRQERDEVFTIGWIGTPSTAPYLAQLTGPLSQLGRETPLKLIVIGGKAPSIPGIAIEEVPWTIESEVHHINRFDVGVMPLPDSEWARGKCAFKLIQYMACAIPVIGSRIGANIDVVKPDCGFLAGSWGEWLEALRMFRDRPELRVTMGQAGRRHVEQHYSLHRNLPLLGQVIRQVAQAGR